MGKAGARRFFSEAGASLAVALCLSYYAEARTGRQRVFEGVSGGEAVSRLKKNTEYLMSLTEEQMLEIVPGQSGIYFTDCPNCDTGAQDRANWEWSPKTPQKLKCRGCGEEYPDNPAYPDDKYLAVRAPEGEHRYYYHEKEDKYRIYFRAHADYLARDYMAKASRDLAELYAAAGDERYAVRAGAILLKFADVFPGWAYKFDYPFRQKLFSPFDIGRIQGAPGGYRTSRWSWWAYMDISEELLQAYDALVGWPGWQNVAGGMGKPLVEFYLFTPMVEHVMGIKEAYTNMSPTAWRGFIHAGRVLDKPEWVAEALKRVMSFLDTHFLYDGYWMETSPSYSIQVEGSLRRITRALGGYKPPDGAPAELGEYIEEGLARIRSAVAMLAGHNRVLRTPDGTPVAVNDTWARRRGSGDGSSRPLLVPGLGIAVLGGGAGESQFFAWLNFTAGVHHKHFDSLDIGLYAGGEELLRDIGYTHTAWRSWTRHTMSHNTVVVNGKNSALDRHHRDLRLRLFASDGAEFSIAEAEHAGAYPGVVRLYRRTLAAVGSDSGNFYLVDVFQVKGGGQHDYLLHGSAARDSTAVVDGAVLRAYEGTLLNEGVEFAFPRAESAGMQEDVGYGFVKNLHSGTIKGGEGVLILEMRMGSRPGTGYRSRIVPCGDADVYLGEAPRIRQAERRDDKLKNYYAPFFCLRRRGEDISSLFVAVHEPLGSAPGVESLSAEVSSHTGMLAVTIGREGGHKDYFVMRLEEDAEFRIDTPSGRLKGSGGYGLVRTEGGRPVRAVSVGGGSLELGGIKTADASGWRGEIRRVCETGARQGSGGWMEVREQIPPEARFGALIVNFSDGTSRGYNICGIESLTYGTRIHTIERPGFEIAPTGVRLSTFPQRTIAGGAEYRLPGMATSGN